jgi:CDP-glucose 4,6-dehydratase
MHHGKFGIERNMNKEFWQGKKVFISGHTGFKGSWLSMWLNYLGAEVYGYSLPAINEYNLFDIAEVEKITKSYIGDIRNLEFLKQSFRECKPEIVFHLAAQPIVRKSYKIPIDTFSTNIMGTANILEAIRDFDSVKSVVIITSDKCYKNNEWLWGYRESDPLGGHDPYSSSKACAELITSSYRDSFFNINNSDAHAAKIASSRAGNVIGGGDWADDRLIPDIIRSIQKNNVLMIRNPNAIRPWQHVLEPLSGYMLLAEKLYAQDISFTEAWNFGPTESNIRSVSSLIELFSELWGKKFNYIFESHLNSSHEAIQLKLDSSKANFSLNWKPKWDFEETIKRSVLWYKAFMSKDNMYAYSINEIQDYQNY